MNRVENAANRLLHIIARRSDPANSGGPQSSGASQEDLRAGLALVRSEADVLFESESEWPIPDLSADPSRAQDESEIQGPPLFLDEPPDLPKAATPDTSHLDDLFPDEGDVRATAATPLVAESMRLEGRTAVTRPRTSVLIAVIVAGSVAGFAIAYLLLQ
jgi:hypothetical protein